MMTTTFPLCCLFRLYDYMGHNTYAPFMIDYVYGTDTTDVSPFKLLNPPVITCNSTTTDPFGVSILFRRLMCYSLAQPIYERTAHVRHTGITDRT